MNIRKGRTLISQLVAAGEFRLQIDAHHHEAMALRRAGAPIEYVFAEPLIPVKSVSSLVMSSQPPHPHAAAWLVDFMISKKGQEMAFKQRRSPALKELSAEVRTMLAAGTQLARTRRNGSGGTRNWCN